jgi:hypothetical protein
MGASNPSRKGLISGKAFCSVTWSAPLWVRPKQLSEAWRFP